ncbi:DsbA family protein [Alteromonas sediminis]|uniref:DsbA family protein n=1 Tax=Alteromonas sediminis TaxID=2259342 RepID=A0A3N5Y2S3_9ALTE|nr:DsbA family protein [Alteromonas sediminis]RPJ66966.1 DsbA family protein [Alteromonas sediminis]
MNNIEFFHDAVCGWCYLLSPRLHEIARRFDVKIIHRCFVLERNENDLAARFVTLENAKINALKQWEQCKLFSENPSLINIEGMRQASFSYPCGLYAAIAAKAAEQLGGQRGHWRFFDAVQYAHLYQNRNISDIPVLLDVAESVGFSKQTFINVMASRRTANAVNKDNDRAVELGVRSVPSVLINERQLISQTLSIEQLEALFKARG